MKTSSDVMKFFVVTFFVFGRLYQKRIEASSHFYAEKKFARLMNTKGIVVDGFRIKEEE